MKTSLALFGSIVVLAACKSGGATGAGGTTASGSTTGTATGPATGATTSSTGTGVMPPSCNGVRYCDNFESYPVGPVMNAAMLGPWKATVQGGATMTVDSVKAFSGSKALHITVPAGAAMRGTLNQTVMAGLVPGNDMFGRAMVFYSNVNGNDLPLGVHSWLFNSAGMSTAAKGNVTMNMGGGGMKLQLNYHPPAPATEQSVQGGMISAGAWHCVQWEYNGSGTPSANDAKVWVDGTLAVEATAAKMWNFATPWSSFDFGFTHYQTLMNGVDVYLDDFALNETMIPCPAQGG